MDFKGEHFSQKGLRVSWNEISLFLWSAVFSSAAAQQTELRQLVFYGAEDGARKSLSLLLCLMILFIESCTL